MVLERCGFTGEMEVEVKDVGRREMEKMTWLMAPLLQFSLEVHLMDFRSLQFCLFLKLWQIFENSPNFLETETLFFFFFNVFLSFEGLM